LAAVAQCGDAVRRRRRFDRCGHSVGREGPVIHIGATSASLLGQWLRLPNNSIRTLVGCGVAGSIAASFNTPIAGVVFAMEVVLLEYTLAGFAPVILAAMAATAVSRIVYGPIGVCRAAAATGLVAGVAFVVRSASSSDASPPLTCGERARSTCIRGDCRWCCERPSPAPSPAPARSSRRR